MKRLLIVIGVFCLAPLSAAAQGIAEISVNGNKAEVKVELVSGLSADLTVSFEQVIGLSASGSQLGISASAVNPTDIDLLSRMPDAQLVTIPAAFPVVIAIEPPATGPLAFTGPVTIELHTHDLSYTLNTPLRLFAADAGGPFHDITYTVGMGSYRVGGSKGGFSEFIIVADLRSATDVIGDKFDRLQTTLDDNCNSISPAVLTILQQDLDDAWSWYLAGDLISAVKSLKDLMDVVATHGGEEIPNAWRASRDLVNAAGELHEGAATLRFSLSLAASS